jgi:hypothetical protein
VNSDLKVKGVINEISIDKIKVDDKWIEVSSISTIISHNYNGFIGVAIGAGVLINGIFMPKSDGGGSETITIDYAAGWRSITIMAGVLISATSAITIPKNYRSEKFIFKTYLVPKK